MSETEIEWPEAWQEGAREAVLPYLGGDARLEIIVGDPVTSIDGTVLAGHLYLDGVRPRVIHDRSGRADVYPWPLLDGPVLRIYLLCPRRRRQVIFAHEQWTPRLGDKG